MHVLVRRGRSCHMSYKCLFIALKFSLFCFYNSLFGLLMTLCIVTITVLYFIAFRLLKNIIIATLLQLMITISANDWFHYDIA